MLEMYYVLHDASYNTNRKPSNDKDLWMHDDVQRIELALKGFESQLTAKISQDERLHTLVASMNDSLIEMKTKFNSYSEKTKENEGRIAILEKSYSDLNTVFNIEKRNLENLKAQMREDAESADKRMKNTMLLSGFAIALIQLIIAAVTFGVRYGLPGPTK